MKKIITPPVRILDPSRLLTQKAQTGSGARTLNTAKPAYPPIKMPLLPDGFYKGRDRDCW